MCICHHELDSFPILKDVLMRYLSGDIKECNFWLLCNVNIWKICINSVNIFKRPNARCYKTMCG